MAAACVAIGCGGSPAPIELTPPSDPYECRFQYEVRWRPDDTDEEPARDAVDDLRATPTEVETADGGRYRIVSASRGDGVSSPTQRWWDVAFERGPERSQVRLGSDVGPFGGVSAAAGTDGAIAVVWEEDWRRETRLAILREGRIEHAALLPHLDRSLLVSHEGEWLLTGVDTSDWTATVARISANGGFEPVRTFDDARALTPAAGHGIIAALVMRIGRNRARSASSWAWVRGMPRARSTFV